MSELMPAKSNDFMVKPSG